MIELEFSRSKDPDIFGLFRSYKQNMLLGSSLSCDIIIEDRDILPAHLIFKSVTAGVLIESTSKEAIYFTNGKKVLGTKLHRTGDNIRIGGTEFIIKSYIFEPPVDYRAEMADKLEKLRQSPDGVILEDIEKEILWIEREINAQ